MVVITARPPRAVDRRGAFELAASRARGVLAAGPLCDHCLGRLFANSLMLSSHRRLGARLRAAAARRRPPAAPCRVCRGLMDGLAPFHSRVLEAAAGYRFSSVLVGVTLKASMLERDDRVRSRHGLAGAGGVKAGVSAALAAALAASTGSAAVASSPDLAATVDFRDGSVSVRSRPVVLAGRYAKASRGLPQRQAPCAGCAGKGCAACSFLGAAAGPGSVEGLVAGFLREKFSGGRVKVTWIGGEDRDSLVGGDGRPFFAQVLDPRRRDAPLGGGAADLGGVAVAGLRRVRSIPRRPVRFRSVAEARVAVLGGDGSRLGGPVPEGDLGRLDALSDCTVASYDGAGARSERSLRLLGRAPGGAPGSFTMVVDAEGGLPLRRLIEGGEVFPNVPDLLGAPCSCERLDFRGVRVVGLSRQGGARRGPARRGGSRARRAGIAAGRAD